MRTVLAVSLFAASFSALLFAPSAHAFTVDFASGAVEGFENINTLSGDGWVFATNSTQQPVAATTNAGWRQGDSSGLGIPSEAGTASSYVYIAGQNVSLGDPATSAGGLASVFLITPQVNFVAGGTLTFSTRTKLGNFNGEFLEVLQSSSGASTNVGTTPTSLGDFSNVLLSVGDLADNTVYPGGTSANNTYGTFSITTPTSGSGRFAFRYSGNDFGQNGSQGTIITLDSASYAVPEPSLGFSGVLAAGCMAIAGRFSRKLKKA
jgi:hypothetical protein